MMRLSNGNIMLIDFEFSSYNFIAYDVANQWNERICNFEVKNDDGFEINYTNYPDYEAKKKF